MKTEIVYPDSLSCVACGEVGTPKEGGGSFDFVGIMHSPLDGSPCFPGDIYGVCRDCYDLAYAEMEELLTPRQRLAAAVRQWLRPVKPLTRVWFALMPEQHEAWAKAMAEFRNACDLTEEVRR